MYINLLHLPLGNFACLFFLFFLSFPLNIFVSFVFIALFPIWHLALVLFSSLCFSQFCSGRYNFWFPFFTRWIYCTLFLLDCFDFAYGYINICLYSITFFYCCYKPLHTHWAFAPLWSFPFLFYFFIFFFLLLFFLSFYNLKFQFFKIYYIFSTFFPLFSFLLFFSPCN